MTIPAQKGRIVKALPETECNYHDVLFELNHKILDTLGVNLTESLVSLKGGEIVLPVENNAVHLNTELEIGSVQCGFHIGVFWHAS